MANYISNNGNVSNSPRRGKFTGHPAYFIRLAGCDVGCSWCDVKESWPADEYPLLSACEAITKRST